MAIEALRICDPVTQDLVDICKPYGLSVAITKNHSNAEIAFRIAATTWFTNSKTFPMQPFHHGLATF